jgi:hypothetical protein
MYIYTYIYIYIHIQPTRIQPTRIGIYLGFFGYLDLDELNHGPKS